MNNLLIILTSGTGAKLYYISLLAEKLNILKFVIQKGVHPKNGGKAIFGHKFGHEFFTWGAIRTII